MYNIDRVSLGISFTFTLVLRLTHRSLCITSVSPTIQSTFLAWGLACLPMLSLLCVGSEHGKNILAYLPIPYLLTIRSASDSNNDALGVWLLTSLTRLLTLMLNTWRYCWRCCWRRLTLIPIWSTLSPTPPPTEFVIGAKCDEVDELSQAITWSSLVLNSFWKSYLQLFPNFRLYHRSLSSRLCPAGNFDIVQQARWLHNSAAGLRLLFASSPDRFNLQLCEEVPTLRAFRQSNPKILLASAETSSTGVSGAIQNIMC